MKSGKEFQRILPTLFTLACVVLFTSCSMSFEKRLYRKGYHVEVIKNKSRHGGTHSSFSRESSVVVLPHQNLPVVRNDQPTSLKPESDVFIATNTTRPNISIKPKINKRSVVKLNTKKLSNGSDCDEITLKDGMKIEAVIVSIGETEIVYKKCNFTDGPSYILSTTQVDIIHLRNGDYYKPKGYGNMNTNTNVKSGNGVGELVIGILACFFALFAFAMSFFVSYGGTILSSMFGSVGFILGIIGTILSAVKMNPQNQSKTIPGLIMAALAIVLFMVTIAILVLV